MLKQSILWELRNEPKSEMSVQPANPQLRGHLTIQKLFMWFQPTAGFPRLNPKCCWFGYAVQLLISSLTVCSKENLVSRRIYLNFASLRYCQSKITCSFVLWTLWSLWHSIHSGVMHSQLPTFFIQHIQWDPGPCISIVNTDGAMALWTFGSRTWSSLTWSCKYWNLRPC